MASKTLRQDCLAHERMSEVMATSIVNRRTSSDKVPENQDAWPWPCGIGRRGKDMRAPAARLPVDDGSNRPVQKHAPGPGLAAREIEQSVSDLLPSQVLDLTAPATGIRKQADDIGLRFTGRPFSHTSIKRGMEALNLVERQETGEFRRVRSPRSVSSATFAFSSPENLRRLLLICIPPSGGGIHLNDLSDFPGPPQMSGELLKYRHDQTLLPAPPVSILLQRRRQRERYR